MGMPLLMPPCVPPEKLELVRTLPFSVIKGSLCAEPRILLPSKPDPMSKPLQALMESMAFARSASRRSNTGAPSPAGAPSITHVTMPPRLSPDSLVSLIRASICTAS